MKDDFITLSQLNGLIREVFEMNFVDDIWLVAEIAELRIAGAGHCYLELVEKKGEKIVARIKANIWSYQYQRIAMDFFAATNSKLKKGMKVLLSVGISYHALYGMSLVVKNIDPNYSLGDLERRKVQGTETPSDLMTKYLTRQVMDGCMGSLGQESVSGRAKVG